MTVSNDQLLKTREVLERTGITHQVLYRYVTLGLIEEAGTTKGGQRLFHPRVVELIHRIRGLIDTGYSLRHLKEIFFKPDRVRRACGAVIP
jgi:DNA-binding transcriptional MerR regulator